MIEKRSKKDLAQELFIHIRDYGFILGSKKRQIHFKDQKNIVAFKQNPVALSLTPMHKKPLPEATTEPLTKILSEIKPLKDEPLKEEPPKEPSPKEALPKKEKISQKQDFKLEKVPSSITNLSFSTKKHLQAIDASLPLLDHIPEDIKAKERQKRGICLYAIAILVFEKDKKKLTFLKNVENVLSKEFFPTKLYNATSIEEKNDWKSFLSSKSLKLIITSDHEIFHAKNLLRLYKEIPADQEDNLSLQAQRTVQNIPLFLLPDIALYFKQPVLKRSLYKALCHKIKTL